MPVANSRGMSYYEGFYDLFDINEEEKTIEYDVCLTNSQKYNVKIMAEKTEEAALLAKTEGAPDNGRVLVMTDGEETLGYVVIALEDDTLVFYGFSVSGQTDFTKAKPDPMTTFVLDTLMRSAASFGETNGMNHIRTAFPDFFDFFKQRGFTVAEDHAEAPMSLIVHYE